MRFNRGGFSRKGEFDRLDVQTDVPVTAATVIVTPVSPIGLDWTIPTPETIYRLDFDTGSVEIVAGYIITGGISLATAEVSSVVITSGSWATFNAAGYLQIGNISGTFIDDETIMENNPVWDPVLEVYNYGTAIANGTPYLTMSEETVSVAGSIDALWFGVTVADATVTLPAVMYYQMLDYTILLEKTVTVSGEKFLDWVLNTIEPAAPIRAVPGTPQVLPYIATTQIKSQSASRKLIDKMMMAKYEFAGAITNPDTYFYYVEMIIPDYLGNDQKVFVGFIPSSTATFEAADSSISYTAYDYSWYLTMQYLDNAHKVLLTPDEQQANTRYRLNYTHPYTPILYWDVGQFIYGQTGHCTGKILVINLSGTSSSGSHYIEIDCVTGVKIGGYYFNDGEVLEVNGVVEAAAYGHEVDVTGVVVPLLPDAYVTELLGGANYEKVTGIYPYRIIAIPTGWSSTSDPVAVQFAFEDKTTKIQAIERIAKYIRYIFMIKTLEIGGITYTAAYFIPESDIDDPIGSGTGLDLPAKQTFTKSTDPFIASPFTCDCKGEERYNKVTVRCQDLSGNWIESTYQSPGLVAGDELPIEYYEINQDIASQTECDDRRDDLVAYYSNQILTYTGTFLERSDLRLLQQLEFIGYTEIPAAGNPYRIIGINYEHGEAGTLNQVTCTIISNAQFQFWLNLNRVFTDSITEIQNIVKGELDKLGANEVGEVVSIDSTAGTAIIKTEAGIIKTVRNPT